MTTTRRHLLAAALGGLAAPRLHAQPGVDAREAARSSHFPFGPVVPARRLEAWAVRTHAGSATELPALLRGKVSALHLMFTGCSATCPIQGALFAEAQRRRPPRLAQAQFVSLSIDALGDTPQALAAWLKGFGAAPGWLAALPRPQDVDAIVTRLGQGGEGRLSAADAHPGQVYVFDREARLVYRTPGSPRPAQILEALDALS